MGTPRDHCILDAKHSLGQKFKSWFHLRMFWMKSKIINFLKNLSFWSSLVAQWVKDLVLSLLWLGFNPCPGNFRMPWTQPKKQKERRKEKRNLNENHVQRQLSD